MPSAEQWQYAAKGGNKSQDYTYAGSNTPGDVAWYSANCTEKLFVKTKAPNELGIYDMSGNVEELTTTLYSLNHIGSFKRFGGFYGISSAEILPSSYRADITDSYTSSYSVAGFRLILTCN